MVMISILKNNNSRKIFIFVLIFLLNEVLLNLGFVVEFGGLLVDLMVEVLLVGRIEKWGVKFFVVICVVVMVVMGIDVLMFCVMIEVVDMVLEVIEGVDLVLFLVVMVDLRVVMLFVVVDDVVFFVK